MPSSMRLVDKEIVSPVSDQAKIFISQLVEIDGIAVEDIRRATIADIIAVLQMVGINADKADLEAFNAHAGNLENPHIVTKEQLGLGEVENYSAAGMPLSDAAVAALAEKVSQDDYNEAIATKADLVAGKVKEEQLPYFNKSRTLYIGDTPLYGTRFVDVDEDGNILIRADGAGDYLLTALEDGTVMAVKVKTQIADDLLTDSDTAALSARQGKLLSSWIGTLGNLLTTAKTNLVAAINELFNSLKAHKENTDNPHSVTKSQVGLGNVENTADAEKEVLSATKLKTPRNINGVGFNGTEDITIEDNTKIPLSQKGKAEGVAELDGEGIIPETQLPHFNKTPNVYVDGKLLNPVVFFDTDGNGGFILREDGSGEYLLHIPEDGVPRLKYIGNTVTDEITGIRYSLTITNGAAVLEQII